MCLTDALTLPLHGLRCMGAARAAWGMAAGRAPWKRLRHFAAQAWPAALGWRPGRAWPSLWARWPSCLPAKVGRLLPFCLLITGCATGCDQRPSTAFFYGAGVPVAALARFDRVVVEAENVTDLGGLRSAGADVFAYVSVGEAEGWRALASALPAGLFLGRNNAWHSRIADLSQPGWRHYLIEQRMAPLWQSGYRGFFLDTLDSYQQVAAGNAQQARVQSSALVALIREISQRFPGVKLLLNRGFAELPEIAPLAVGLVAESLFQRWDAASSQYQPVPESERQWLRQRLDEARLRHGLPVTVIDYVPPDQPQLARETARQIEALGFTPWVSTPGLDIVGVGAEK